MRTAVRFLERDKDAALPLYFFGSEQANERGGVVHAADCRGATGPSGLLESYRRLIGQQTLSGPTTFVPLIREAMHRVRTTGRYHILLIITDGAVTVRPYPAPALRCTLPCRLSLRPLSPAVPTRGG
jgi:hypothetical protein